MEVHHSSPFETYLQNPYSTVLVSILFFSVLNYGSKKFMTLPEAISLSLNPNAWHNKLVCVIYSSFIGIFSLIAVLQNPAVINDPIHLKINFSTLLVSISLGYLIYDTTFNLINRRFSNSWELILQNVVTIIAYILTLLEIRLILLMNVTLLTELNSVFVHIRQLMVMSGKNMNSSGYRLVSYLAVITFCVRYAVVGWLIGCSVSYQSQIGLIKSRLFLAFSLLMLCLHTVLLMRICVADIIQIPRPLRPVSRRRSINEKALHIN